MSSLVASYCNIRSKTIAYIVKHGFIFSFFISTLIMVVMWLFGLMRWEGSDDFIISQLLMGASGEYTPFVLTVSIILGKIVVNLQRIFPIVNWFTCLEILSIWSAFIVFEFFVIKHASPRAIPLVTVMLCTIEPLFFLTLQYTRVAFILPFAGVLLMFDSTLLCLSPEEAICSLVKLNTAQNILKAVEGIVGIMLFAFGSLFRYSCFFAAMAYVGILALCFLVSSVKKHFLQKTSALLTRFLLLLLSALILSSGLNHINNRYYRQWENETNYKSYNKIRADVIDYLPSEYSDSLSSENLSVSYNDWYMMKCYVINDNTFSYEYFSEVYTNLCSMDNQSHNSDTYNWGQLFNYRTGRYSGHQTLFVISCIIVCIAFFASRKNGRISILVNIFGTTLLLCFFLARKRLPPWVIDPICFMSLYIALLFIFQPNETGNRESTSGIKQSCIKILTSVVLIVCSLFNLSTVHKYANIEYCDEDLTQLILLAEESNCVFLLDNISYSPFPYIDIYGPTYCFELGKWDNIIRVSGWDIGNPEKDRQKAAWGIDSILYSLVEGKSYLISKNNSSTFNMYETYFMEHYGINVCFSLVENCGEYGVYKCSVM